MLDTGDDLQNEEQRLEFFTSKSRAHSMPDNSVLLPPRLVNAPKAISTRRIAASTETIHGDPTLPTGVMPHGRVNVAQETDNGGEDTGTYAFARSYCSSLLRSTSRFCFRISTSSKPSIWARAMRLTKSTRLLTPQTLTTPRAAQEFHCETSQTWSFTSSVCLALPTQNKVLIPLVRVGPD